MAKHRAERKPTQWRREYRWLKNRWMFFWKPAAKKKLKNFRLFS